ncbi:hypothetical protein D3C81_1053820 [compost metagenome]
MIKIIHNVMKSEHAAPRLEIYAALSKVNILSKKAISGILDCMIIRVAVTKR